MTSMQRRIFIAGWPLAAAPFSAQAQKPETTMQLHRNGTLPANRPPEDTFTGDVFIGAFFRREAPSRLVGAIATFNPRSRTPWKVNAFGQTLIVTSGVGWAQCEGEEIKEIRAGDVIWCPPGQRHWEGATPDQAMTYVAMHEGIVEFRGKVTDEECQKGPLIASSQR